MNLIRRAIRFFNGLRKEQCAVDRVSQGYRCRNVAFEHGNYGGYRSGLLLGAIGNDAAHGKRNADYPVQVGETGRVLEIGNGQAYRGHLNVFVPQFDHARIQPINRIWHFITPRLKPRFGRSCRAFVNAWREK